MYASTAFSKKEWEIDHFLDVIKPYVADIQSMKYKTYLAENISLKTERIKNKLGEDLTIKTSSSTRRILYTANEIETLIRLKKFSYTDKVNCKSIRQDILVDFILL